MRWGIIFILAVISNELDAVELPNLAEKSIERYEDSIDRFIEKLHRDQRGLLQLLRTQSAAAAQRGDQRVVDALAAKSAEIINQLNKIETAVKGDGDTNLQKNDKVLVAPDDLKVPLAVGVPRVIGINGGHKFGYRLGSLPRGTVIKLQYSHGTWSNGHLGTHSPDTTSDGQCQLCIAGSVPESQLFNEQIVKVPIGTSGNPFIYRLQRDFTDVCLRMSDGTHGLGPDFADNSGTVFYAVAIGR